MPSLQSLHTFALPAQSKSLCVIDDVAQLERLDYSQPYYVLGEGSNTVFIGDYDGLVIKMATKGVVISKQDDFIEVIAQAGENWHSLVSSLLKQGIPGLENLALIPGTVGAAPVQNIGAYGVEICRFVHQVRGFNLDTLKFINLSNADCQFHYRDSVFKHALKGRFIITEVTLRLSTAWRATLSYGPLQQLPKDVSAQVVFDEVIKIRQSKLPDPSQLPNAGSFFKNPMVGKLDAEQLLQRFPDMPIFPVDEQRVKLAAGWLIDNAGLKGTHVGAIRVYEKQALVLVNAGQGCGEELKQLIVAIQHKVNMMYGVVLEHEVRLIDCAGECQLQVGGND